MHTQVKIILIDLNLKETVEPPYSYLGIEYCTRILKTGIRGNI